MNGGLDYGTTNSAIGIQTSLDECNLIKLGNNSISMPSSIFHEGNTNTLHYGDEAIIEYTSGTPGRLMISLKRALGQNLKTVLGRKKYSICELSGNLISYMKHKAEGQMQDDFDSIVVGRPVKFHDSDKSKDEEAQRELETAVKIAGFKNIEFLPEPVGGIYGSIDKLDWNNEAEKLILICDLGGGTSDFSIAKVKRDIPKSKIEIIGNEGIYIGGDELTAQLIRGSVSSYLGKDSEYKEREKWLKVPNSPYTELKYWNHINNIGHGKIKSAISKTASRVRDGEEKIAFGRIKEISDDIRKGHKLHTKINETKILLSDAETVLTKFDIFENPFDYQLDRNTFDHIINDASDKIVSTMQETLLQAGIIGEQINDVILIGGTTKVPLIRKKIETVVGGNKIIEGDTFTAVAEGLTKYSGKIFK